MRLSILVFLLGVVLLQMQPALLGAGAYVGLALLALTGLPFLAGRRGLRVGVLACCALLGFGWAGWLAQQRLADQLPVAWETREIVLTGVVAALPQRFERGERFVFDVERVHSAAARVPQHLLLSWYHGWDAADAEMLDAPASAAEAGVPRALRPGERWRLTVRLKRPHGNANAHGFDYEAWLLESNIRATGSVRGAGERLDDFVWAPGYLIERLRDAIRERFLAALPDAPYLGVLIALTVGDQRAIPNAQWTVFNRTGITHLMSISGLHVTMVAALCALLVGRLWRCSESLLRRLPAPYAALLAGWLAAFAYALLAGFEVPAQRTLYMLSVVVLALVTGRNWAISRTLLWALWVVLVIDPWAVLATGFWLSFGAVGLLLLVGSARLGAPRAWHQYLARWSAAQWAVTLGSLPLLLFFFQQFSLVSPLANALAIPWVSWLVTPLALLFAVLPWPPLLALDHWLLAQLMALLETLADWPLWQQAAPPWPTLLLALGGALWLLLPRGFPARAVGLVLLLPALVWPAPRPAPGEVWVDVLDVGQGLAVLVRTAAHALLYDSGPVYGGTSSAGQRVVVPFLRAVGVAQLDALVISHRDQDHAGGYPALQASLPIGRLLTSMRELGGEPCRAGQAWAWDGVRLTLLHPQAADYLLSGKQANNLSCVLRVDSGDGRGRGSVLLTGDIDAADERALLRDPAAPLAATVLVVPHHGGKASSTPEFIAAVGAREVVFSAGYRNPFRHPQPQVVERYAASRQWRTDQHGGVHLVIAGGALQVSAWRDEHRRYWYGQ